MQLYFIRDGYRSLGVVRRVGRYPYHRELTGEHEQLGRVYGARGQHDLSACQSSPLETVAHELHAVSTLAVRVDEHLGHVRPECHVQVSPEPDRLEEGLRRAAPVAPAHRELIQPVPGLDVAVGVPDLIAHFFAGLQKRYA